LPPPRQHCELWYIAFDILHNGDSGVNELPLRERQRMLEAAVLPGEARPLAGSAVCGRMVPLLPGKTHIGGMLASRLGKGEEDISSMLAEVGWVRELHGIRVHAGTADRAAEMGACVPSADGPHP
jgi:hypothetical protein